MSVSTLDPTVCSQHSAQRDPLKTQARLHHPPAQSLAMKPHVMEASQWPTGSFRVCPYSCPLHPPHNPQSLFRLFRPSRQASGLRTGCACCLGCPSSEVCSTLSSSPPRLYANVTAWVRPCLATLCKTTTSPTLLTASGFIFLLGAYPSNTPSVLCVDLTYALPLSPIRM